MPAPNPKCPSDSLEEAKKAQRSLANFAVNLYKNASAAVQDKNQIVSPISVALALAMLENGAGGNTEMELEKQLIDSQASDDVLGVYRALEKQLTIDQDKTKLQLANGLFYDKEAHLKQDYQQSTQDCLDAQVQVQDFKNQLEQTRQNINKFIADKTDNKIPELFKAGVLSPSEEVVLTSAIYLKSTWEKAFSKSDTKQGVFYRLGQQQDQQQVPFMNAEGQYRHVDDEKLQVVELKYEKADLSFNVILPKQRDGLKDVEAQLSGDQLRSLLSRLEAKKVKVQLPKYGVRSPSDLKSILGKMGLADLFGRQADLSRMSQDLIQLTQAVHEAYIKIDEDGTEAAAATGIGGVAAVMPLPGDSIPFVADHPFLYAIVHNPTGAVVFIGKINEITQQE
jgi:serpin B